MAARRPRRIASFCVVMSASAAGTACGGSELLDVAGRIAVVIGKGDLVARRQSGGFQPREKLLRPGNSAEGDDRAGNRRNFHPPVEAPDWSLSSPRLRSSFSNSGFICRNCNTPARCIALRGSRRLPAGSRLILPVLDDSGAGCRYRGRAVDAESRRRAVQSLRVVDAESLARATSASKSGS